MNRQTLIALGVAVVLGIVAVIVANAYLTGREKQMAASPQGVVRVAVASMPFNYGDDITPDKVKFVNYPATSLPPGVHRSMAELLPEGKRRVALRPIQPNQPLLASDLSGSGQNASIAALLPDGMRASTVRINDISGVAGFIKANDTVDVLVTRQAIGPDGAQGDQQVTDVLLQNVRVIAMGQDAAGGSNQPVVQRSATLEVSPVDAQKLTLGQALGQLSLVLRKPGDEQNIPQVETVSLNDLRYSLNSSRANAAQPAAPQQRARIARLSQPRRAPVQRAAMPVRPATSTVSVTRGLETKDYEVGGYAH
ncbi:MAG: Flp pilus assembly protein CpaB [Pseudomonadota bacterium]|nr:Flp pilus assembly protein CpaB [Pseudomonadota bacterium]